MKLETIAAPIVHLALTEDLGSGDVTAAALVSETARAQAVIVAREDGVVAGLEVAGLAFRELDPEARLANACRDGNRVAPGEPLVRIDALARAVLSAERVALNLLGHLSGIATRTAAVVEALRGTGVVVRDTRKTLPGLRMLEKYAVRVGGGRNHRFGLFDMVMIKENHLKAAGSIAGAVAAARRVSPDLPIEVEVHDLDEARAARTAGADWILLDNLEPEEVAEVMSGLGVGQSPGDAPPRPAVEASGRIDVTNARAYAEAGVHAIALGSITHSAPALDLSLVVESVSDLA